MTDTNREPLSFRDAIAGSLIHLRHSHHVTQRDIAVAMNMLGFNWATNTVTKIEKSDRTLTAEELVGLMLVTRAPLHQLTQTPHGEPVLVGTLPVEARVLTNLASSSDKLNYPDLSEAADLLSWEARAMITGDVETPRQVEEELARRDEARETLGLEPPTVIQRRRERAAVWLKVLGIAEEES